MSFFFWKFWKIQTAKTLFFAEFVILIRPLPLAIYTCGVEKALCHRWSSELFEVSENNFVCFTLQRASNELENASAKMLQQKKCS